MVRQYVIEVNALGTDNEEGWECLIKSKEDLQEFELFLKQIGHYEKLEFIWACEGMDAFGSRSQASNDRLAQIMMCIYRGYIMRNNLGVSINAKKEIDRKLKSWILFGIPYPQIFHSLTIEVNSYLNEIFFNRFRTRMNEVVVIDSQEFPLNVQHETELIRRKNFIIKQRKNQLEEEENFCDEVNRKLSIWDQNHPVGQTITRSAFSWWEEGSECCNDRVSHDEYHENFLIRFLRRKKVYHYFKPLKHFKKIRDIPFSKLQMRWICSKLGIFPMHNEASLERIFHSCPEED